MTRYYDIIMTYDDLVDLQDFLFIIEEEHSQIDNMSWSNFENREIFEKLRVKLIQLAGNIYNQIEEQDKKFICKHCGRNNND